MHTSNITLFFQFICTKNLFKRFNFARNFTKDVIAEYLKSSKERGGNNKQVKYKGGLVYEDLFLLRFKFIKCVFLDRIFKNCLYFRFHFLFYNFHVSLYNFWLSVTLMNNPNGISCCECPNPIVSCELSGWSLIEFIFFCYLLWWIFYFFLLVVTKQSAEWCCRLVTFFHGCLISYHALRDAYVNKSRIDFKRIPLSASKKNYLSYMFSYFLFDFCWIHFFGNETKIIYAHHIASILIIFNVLLRNIGGAGIAYGAAGLEVTNPYLQLRWFLRSHGYHNTVIHRIIELWFVFLFTIIRVFGGTVLVYSAVVKSDMDFITKLSYLFIYGISMVLQWQIMMFVRKKYILPGNRVLFIRSRVSISLYFQRRTLDEYEEDCAEGNEEESGADKLSSRDIDSDVSIDKETSVRKKSSVKELSASQEIFSKAGSSTYGESSSVAESTIKEPPSIRKSSTNGESSSVKESTNKESTSIRKSSTNEESSASKESSSNKNPLPPTNEEPILTEENTTPDNETVQK